MRPARRRHGEKEVTGGVELASVEVDGAILSDLRMVRDVDPLGERGPGGGDGSGYEVQLDPPLHPSAAAGPAR